MKDDHTKAGFSTLLIHHRGSVCPNTGAVSPPIYASSTFKQHGVNEHLGFEYSRGRNPTRQVLEDYIADLECGNRGFAFGSGMAAISSCFLLLSAGDHVLLTSGLYGGTYRVLSRIFNRFGIQFSMVDTTSVTAVREAIQENTRVLYLETPSNPLMQISDIHAVSEVAHARGLMVMVDNTFMSPYLQRPLLHGADIVIHSASKFLGGHSDLIAGLVVTKEEEQGKALGLVQSSVGAILPPYDSWLLVRSMKTLGVRVSRSQASAASIAEWLAGRPEVEQVLYPGLPGHPGREIHAKQADGAGAIVSFRLGDQVPAKPFLGALKIWSLAVSLGAVESIVTQPAHMTHASYPPSLRKQVGITDQVIRLSVGLEDPEDLIADIEQALEPKIKE